MTALIVWLSIFSYVVGGLATARAIYASRVRSGAWGAAYDSFENGAPVVFGFFLWPFAVAYLWATRPLKEERASKLQRRITELERELRPYTVEEL